MNPAPAGLVAALLALWSGPAVALTCDRSGIERTYQDMQASGLPHVLVLGRFSDLQPVTLAPADRPHLVLASGFKAWRGQVTGHIGSPTGFDRPLSAPVTLILPDYSDIGGTDTATAVEQLSEKTGLVWLLETDMGYQLIATPCQTLIDTTADSVPRVLGCLQGGSCSQP